MSSTNPHPIDYELLSPEDRLGMLREMWMANERGYAEQHLIEEIYRKVRTEATLKSRALKSDTVRSRPYLELAAVAAQKVDQAIAGKMEMSIALTKIKADHAALEPIVEQRRQEREAEAEARQAEEEQRAASD